ncbi:MAG: tRNA1(Val) (adenine(37)-N6)-methyltransferase [Candidatus Ornithomonoglobus sp.]
MASDEILDDLQNGYYIWQRNDGFKFGIDAVLLSDFAKDCTGRVMDLCTGTGIIPLLLAAKSKAKEICAVEIQREIADMARRSVEYNGLNDKIHIECADLKDAPLLFGRGSFNCVTVNPPYMKAGSGLVNDGDMKTISRHEVRCTLDDVIRVCAALLKPLGKLFMVHRPSRLADIFCCMREYKIEPKLIRLVAPRAGKEPNLVLVHGIKNAKSDLKLLPQLIVYNDDGSYSKEIDEIYGR